eukprot:5168472-Prymnesium_polylepis.1
MKHRVRGNTPSMYNSVRAPATRGCSALGIFSDASLPEKMVAKARNLKIAAAVRGDNRGTSSPSIWLPRRLSAFILQGNRREVWPRSNVPCKAQSMDDGMRACARDLSHLRGHTCEPRPVE